MHLGGRGRLGGGFAQGSSRRRWSAATTSNGRSSASRWPGWNAILSLSAALLILWLSLQAPRSIAPAWRPGDARADVRLDAARRSGRRIWRDPDLCRPARRARRAAQMLGGDRRNGRAGAGSISSISTRFSPSAACARPCSSPSGPSPATRSGAATALISPLRRWPAPRRSRTRSTPIIPNSSKRSATAIRRSSATIERFRADEREHRDTAIAAGAETAWVIPYCIRRSARVVVWRSNCRRGSEDAYHLARPRRLRSDAGRWPSSPASPCPGAEARAASADPRVNQLIVYGDDPCPASTDEEITVCARLPSSDRYRIPPNLRDNPNDPASQSWAGRAMELQYVGRSGTDSCSTSGAGGFTGCLSQMINLARAERRAAGTDINWTRMVEEARQREARRRGRGRGGRSGGASARPSGTSRTDGRWGRGRSEREIGFTGSAFLSFSGMVGAGIFALPGTLHAQFGAFSPWLFPSSACCSC